MSYSDRTFPQGLYVTFWGEGTEPELSLVSKIDFFPRRLRNLGRGGCRCVDEQSDTMAPVTAKAELVCRCFSAATAAAATAASITGGGAGTRYFGLDKTVDVRRRHPLLRANRDRMWDYAT